MHKLKSLALVTSLALGACSSSGKAIEEGTAQTL